MIPTTTSCDTCETKSQEGIPWIQLFVALLLNASSMHRLSWEILAIQLLVIDFYSFIVIVVNCIPLSRSASVEAAISHYSC